LHYVAKAGVAKRGSGYGSDGYDRGFAGQIGHGAEELAAFAFVPIEKIADGGGAEEQDSFEVAGEELVLPFALRLHGKRAIRDDFGDVRADAAERVGQIRAGQITAREKDALASELGGKFLGESQTLMLRGDAAYGPTSSASRLGGDRTHGRDAESSKGIHNVHAKKLRALQQGTNGVRAGEQEPIEGAQIAKRLIQGRYIMWRMERNHGLEHGLGAAGFQLAYEGLGLIGCAGDENAPAG
jgi:hypothetical protein